MCDSYSSLVYMIDKDGYFLKYFLMWLLGILLLSSLIIDVNIYFFWVGLLSLNIVFGYRYII